ncbi:MAG TPA: SoxR reducing system RseC family protein [Wenzhouxiangella sp.]|nr:SoxR reducing system RseC family protein [Wenzhouxiangella sp.]
MIWQLARVVALDDQRLTLAFSAPEHCRRCMQGRGCGAGVFGRLLSRRETRVSLPANLAVARGQWLRVGCEPVQLARAAVVYYGLPLLGFLAGAVNGHLALDGGAGRDIAALTAGLAGFFLVLHFVSRRLRPAWNPVLERLSCEPDDTDSSFSQQQ